MASSKKAGTASAVPTTRNRGVRTREITRAEAEKLSTAELYEYVRRKAETQSKRITREKKRGIDAGEKRVSPPRAGATREELLNKFDKLAGALQSSGKRIEQRKQAKKNKPALPKQTAPAAPVPVKKTQKSKASKVPTQRHKGGRGKKNPHPMSQKRREVETLMGKVNYELRGTTEAGRPSSYWVNKIYDKIQKVKNFAPKGKVFYVVQLFYYDNLPRLQSYADLDAVLGKILSEYDGPEPADTPEQAAALMDDITGGI